MGKTILLLGAIVAGAWGSTPSLPISFEPNRGQARAGVDFLVRGKGYALNLRAGRAELVSGRSHVATVLEGVRNKAEAAGEAPLPGVVNYLRGNDSTRWLTGIPTYSRVRYSGVYRGIDLVYYGSESGRLEYDFVVAPGGDPRQIHLRYEGARSVSLDQSGDLVIDTAGGSLRQHRPVIYQEIGGVRHEVAGRYLLHGTTARLQLDAYDRTHALVIDPAVTWSTFVEPSGGPGNAQAEGVAVDSSGNVYVTGSGVSSYGDVDVFFGKFTAAGANVFATFIGGSYNDYGHAIAVDPAGNIYLVGQTSSPDYPAYMYYGYPSSYGTAFISKINAAGTQLIYSQYLGQGGDAAFGLALDTAGDAYVVGATASTGFPVSSGVPQTSNAGGVDAFVTKFDVNGNGVASTYLGGSGDDYGNAIAVDSAGNAYVTGQTKSTNFPLAGSGYQGHNAGGNDAFITKLSPSLTLVFSTYLGGGSDDFGNGIAVDSSGAVYITGETASTDFPVLGAAQGTFGGGAGDIFITKLNGNGASLVYSTYLGGSGEDFANSITLDGAGDAFVTGGTTSTDLVTSDPFQKSNLGTVNGVVAALDPSGSNVLFASYLGGSGKAPGAAAGAGDSGLAVAFQCAAGLVVGGATASTDFPVTSGAAQTTYPGGSIDAFLTKIAAGGTPSINSGGVVNSASLSAGPVAPGSLITINGSNLAIASQTAAQSSNLPTSLEGVTVSINMNSAPIVSASPGQITVQLPYEVGAGNAVVAVSGACGASQPLVFPVAQAAPYIRQTASGDAVVTNQDGTPNGPSNPAPAGSIVSVSLTGIGPVDNAVATGAPASATPVSNATLAKSATIGGWDAGVQFLGLAPFTVGWAQANLVVPGLSSGAYAVVITVGGVASNGPTMYVQ